MSDSKFMHDDLHRRRFMAKAAGSLLGVGVMPGVISKAQAAGAKAAKVAPRKKPAKNIIYLYMSGGMSHLDTFNPRPDADPEIRGDVKAIKTKADGILLSEYLPKLADHTDKMAIIRSMTSKTGAHQQGQYLMRTSYARRSTIRHPHLAAWNLKYKGRGNDTLPGFVCVNGSSRQVGAGFFDSSHSPLVIGKPEEGLTDIAHFSDVNEDQFLARRKMSLDLDKEFRSRYDDKRISAYTAMYDDAVKLMHSDDLAAFDLTKEPKEVRDSYGDNTMGQGCLLARRLVQRGVNSVEVRMTSWDTHVENFDRVSSQAATLDAALSALLADLESHGLLDDTIVVLATEFGRTPKINVNNGRDHYPQCFTTAIAGGGIKGGTLFGDSDVNGAEVTENPIGIEDFNATVAYGLGLPLAQVLYSPSMRPFTVAHNGQPVTSLFS
ncbi:MAG: DUF1501 domain-containing protein [Verrucomicrobiota bacterium]